MQFQQLLFLHLLGAKNNRKFCFHSIWLCEKKKNNLEFAPFSSFAAYLEVIWSPLMSISLVYTHWILMFCEEAKTYTQSWYPSLSFTQYNKYITFTITHSMPTLKFPLPLCLACILGYRPVWSRNDSVIEPMKYSVWNDDFFTKRWFRLPRPLNNKSLCMH